jgi:predicted small secreted protein
VREQRCNRAVTGSLFQRTSHLKGENMSKALTVLALLLALGTTACNTVRGAGMDIRATGNAVEKAADDAKR